MRGVMLTCPPSKCLHHGVAAFGSHVGLMVSDFSSEKKPSAGDLAILYYYMIYDMI